MDEDKMREHIQGIADFLRKNGTEMRTDEGLRREFELLLEEND